MSDTIEPGSDNAAPAEGVVTPSNEGQSFVPADQPADAAPADNQDGNPDPVDPGEQRQRGPGKRVSELLEDRHYLRQEVAHWREIALRNQQQPQQPAPQAGQGPVQLPPDLAQRVGLPPDPNNFPGSDFDDAYKAQRDEYLVRLAEARLEARLRQGAQQQHVQRAQQQMAKRVTSMVEEGKAAFADFEDVALSPEVPMPPHVVKELTDCEKPAAVAYWLGKNPSEARRIAGLSPSGVARELGRIEARLAAQAPAPQQTAAPTPPRTVRGAGTSGKPSLDSMSVADIQKLLNG